MLLPNTIKDLLNKSLGIIGKPSFPHAERDLREVEQAISLKLASNAHLLQEISKYLLDLGGKRIRPLLAINAARLFGMDKPSPEVIKVSAGIEMIHMATLLHDDIIDRSPTRRSNASAYKRYGIEPTLLAGDFLLVRAFGICAELDEFVVKKTESACVELTEGEMLEGTITPDRKPSFNDYIDIISKKTASLFALSTTVGAYLAGAQTEDIKKLSEYGLAAGVAFQMIDDILDVTATEDVLGKPIGTDLRQKTPTLINLLWLEEDPIEASKFFAISEPSNDDCLRALIRVKESSTISRARDVATEYASLAEQSLLSLSPTAIRRDIWDNLRLLLVYTLKRCL